MVTNPLVSVILIAYNEEKLIKQALDSVLSQKTDFKFEIICHDDASSDKTPEIILEYQKKYPDIIVPILQKENKAQNGHHFVMEYCYPVARGKYIAYIDADDYWTNTNKLQTQVDFLEKNPEYSLCLHNFDFLYEANNKIVRSKCGEQDKDYNVEAFIEWNANEIPQIGTSVFRKDLAINRPKLFYKIGGGKNSKRLISDQPLYIYLALIGKVKFFSESMSVWRRRTETTWMSEGTVEKNINFMKEKIVFLKKLHRLYPNISESVFKKAIGWCMYYIGWLSRDYRLAKRKLCFSNASYKIRFIVYLGCFAPSIANNIRDKMIN